MEIQKIQNGQTGAEAADLILENDTKAASLAASAEAVAGVENLTRNPNFINDFSEWEVNSANIVLSYDVNGLRVHKNDSGNSAVVQGSVFFPSGEVLVCLKVKNEASGVRGLKIGLYRPSVPPVTVYSSEKNIEGDYWNYLIFSVVSPSADNYTLFIEPTSAGSQLLIGNISAFAAAGSIRGELLNLSKNSEAVQKSVAHAEETVGGFTPMVNFDFSNGKTGWEVNTNDLIFEQIVGTDTVRVDATNAVDGAILQARLSYPKGKYLFSARVKKTSPAAASFRVGDFNKGLHTFTVGADEAADWTLFETYLQFTTGATSGANMFNPSNGSAWEVDFVRMQLVREGSFSGDIAALKSEIASTGVRDYFPAPSVSAAPQQYKISGFIEKYRAAEKDITIVQTGDSISTDLNWSAKRADAKFRPPFMTEHNVNSYIEERLRWNGQQYRRFDVSGVFSEQLGGGTSAEVSIDPNNWGYTGPQYYLPITKVIDGGTAAGVSFDIPAGTRRAALIVHTDKAWASVTRVTVGGGAGIWQVFDGAAWVEANGFETSFKEADTLESLGFYTDNAQKRLKFRKTGASGSSNISVRNVGAGRFAYWGIEYSPLPFMFTYIAASKGSHSDTMLKKYDAWMVQSFAPDLIIYQCPVLNVGIGYPRATGSSTFGAQFVNRFTELKTMAPDVMAYTLWVSIHSNFVDTSGRFIVSVAGDGSPVSCQLDANNIALRFAQIEDAPAYINAFGEFTAIAAKKAEAEGKNIYSAALAGSGPEGHTFTIDGSHLNTLGELLAWRTIQTMFNF